MKVPGGATRSRIKRYLWPVRVNKLRLLLRRARHEWHRVHLTDSPISGPISVWDLGPERALIFGPVRKSTAVSVVFKNGNWAELRREYWGQAMTPPFPVAVHPRVLILGLGGGTMVSLAHRVLHPQGITVVERDPVMVGVARTYMGVDDIPNVDVRVTDVHTAIAELKGGDPFDLIIDDIFYLGIPASSDDTVRAYIASLAALLSPTGGLVFNRWFGGNRDAVLTRFAQLLGEHFAQVRRKRVGQRWENELVYASGPRKPSIPGPDAEALGSTPGTPPTRSG
jgi:hypothetical protein